MMSKELLKKAGILGVSFGLMASPLAFADTTTDHSSIDQNQDITVDDEPQDTRSHDTDSGAGSYDREDLTTDHDTQGPDVVDDPESDNMSGGAEYTPEEVVEENRAS